MVQLCANYILLLWYVGHAKLYHQQGSMEHKREILYCAFSCLGYGLYIRSSNLANFKFTPVLVLQCNIDDRASYIRIYRTVPYGIKGSKEERARQSSSSAQQRKDRLRTR